MNRMVEFKVAFRNSNTVSNVLIFFLTLYEFLDFMLCHLV